MKSYYTEPQETEKARNEFTTLDSLSQNIKMDYSHSPTAKAVKAINAKRSATQLQNRMASRSSFTKSIHADSPPIPSLSGAFTLQDPAEPTDSEMTALILEEHSNREFSDWLRETLPEINERVFAQRLQTLRLTPHAGTTYLTSRSRSASPTPSQNATTERLAQYSHMFGKNKKQYDVEISAVEDLVMFTYTLAQADCISVAIVEILKYVKTFISGSLYGNVEKLVNEVFYPSGGPEYDLLVDPLTQLSPHSGDEVRFEKFRSFISTWKDSRSSPLSEYACNIVSLLSVLRMVPYLNVVKDTTGKKITDKTGTGLDEESGQFLVNGYKLFSAKVIDIQQDAWTLTDMAMETCLFFLERGYVAFTTADPTALLYTTSELAKLDLEYGVLISAMPVLQSGLLSKLKDPYVAGIKDEADYGLRVEDLYVKLVRMSQSKDIAPLTRSRLSAKVEKLAHLRVSLLTAQQTKLQRCRPLAIELFGATSVGKTNVCNTVIHKVLSANGFPCGNGSTVTINENDMFESEITANTVCYILDDYANMKTKFLKTSPGGKIIDYINNVPKNAVKAEIDGKGKIPLQPKLVMLTTNVKTLCASEYSMEPVSILRRMDLVVTVELRQSHTDDSGGFDPVAFEKDRDAWELTIQKVKIVRGTVGTDHGYITYLHKVSLLEALDFIEAYSIEHFAQQAKLLERVERNMNDGPCEHGYMEMVCTKCNPVSSFIGPLPESEFIGPLQGPIDVDEVEPDSDSDDDELQLTPEELADELEHQEYMDRKARSLIREQEGSRKMVAHAGTELGEEAFRRTRNRIRENVIVQEAARCGFGFTVNVDDSVEPQPKPRRFAGFEEYLHPETENQAWYNAALLWCLGIWTMSRMYRLRINRLMYSAYQKTRAKWRDYVTPVPMRAPVWHDAFNPYNCAGSHMRALAFYSVVGAYGKLRNAVAKTVVNTLSGIMKAQYGMSAITATGAVVAAMCICYLRVSRTTAKLEKADTTVSTDISDVTEEVRPLSTEQLAQIVTAINEAKKPVSTSVGALEGVDTEKLIAALTSKGTSHEGAEAETPENPWKQVVIAPKHRTSNDGMTIGQMRKRMRNTLYKIVNMDRHKWTNAFPLWGNYWLLPTHFIPEEISYQVKMHRSDDSKLDVNVVTSISPKLWSRIPNTDFTVVQIPKMGDHKRNIGLLGDVREPLENYRHCEMTNLEKDCSITTRPCRFLNYDPAIDTGVTPFPGYGYVSTKPFSVGLCMAPVYTNSKCPVIVGFHLGGSSNEDSDAAKFGVCGIVTKEQILAAAQKCPHRHDVMSTGEFPVMQLGAHYGIELPPHPKNPVHFQRSLDGKEPSLKVIGAHNQPRMNSRSDVKVTPISASIEKHLGVANNYAPPDFKRSKHYWHKALEQMCHGSSDLNLEIVERAFDDLDAVTLAAFTADDLDRVRPLPLEYVASGMDCVKGLDRMPLNTSVGFPINRAKKHFAELGGLDLPGVTESVQYDPIFEARSKEMEECYLRGERAYPIFRACLKDEAVKIGKDKVRVFSSAQMSFNFLLRRYFLPLMLIEARDKEGEGAVGTNCYGPEWSGVARQLRRFPGEKYIAGDFGAYDKKTSNVFVRAAFQTWINVAMHCPNYTAEDLAVMVGVATDISNPVYDFDGVFIQTTNTTASGGSGTVESNGKQNGGYMRYAYYDIEYGIIESKFAETEWEVQKALVPPFQENVALKHYGDDNAMNVSRDCPEFNHTSVKDSLEKIGMVYTMADKTRESVPYIPFSEISFLKRSFVYNAEVDEWFAPLEEASIFKSLHNFMDRGNDATAETISSDAIDNAAGEFFLHGREVYEKRADELRKVVSEHSFLHNSIPTFDEKITEYRKKYLDEKQPSLVRTLRAHAGEDESPATAEHTENLQMSQEQPGWQVNPSAMDPTRIGLEDATTLGKFLERPVLIATEEWAPGVAFWRQIPVWQLWANDPRVSNRLNNFRLLTMEMKLTFIINGNPFAQGCVLASYYPFADTFGQPASRELVVEDQMAESQRTHVYIDPTNSAGGEMVLPFFYEFDALDIVTSDWDDMGSVTLRAMNLLRHSNGATESLLIQVFASAVNIELRSPTERPAGSLLPQEGEEDDVPDEYGTGALSKPASIVASLAAAVKNVPVIGPYATATEIGARITAQFASLHGFSKPAILTDAILASPRPYGHMAQCDGGDTSAKLTIDPKQGLNIGTYSAGIDKGDEMTFSKLAQIESWLTTFQFLPETTPGTKINSVAITPFVNNRGPLFGQGPVIFFTPMGAVAEMFDHWRGTFVVKMVLIANKYARGTLRVVREPAQIDSLDPDYNTAEQYLWDISVEREICFEIGWSSPFAYLDNPLVSTNLNTFHTNLPVNLEASKNFTNGFLSVYTFTELTSPGETPVAAEINVFVSMKDDFAVASPTDSGMSRASQFFPQEGDEIVPHAGMETMPQAPTCASKTVMFSKGQTPAELNAVYMGETVVSIRKLIKRFAHVRTINAIGAGNNDSAQRRVTFANTILFRGYDPNGEDVGVGDIGNTPYNFSSNTAIHWFMPMFAGWRGGLRYKVAIAGEIDNNTATLMGDILLARSPRAYQRNGFTAIHPLTNLVPPYGAEWYGGTSRGVEIQPLLQRGVVEGEIPYQMPRRFARGRRQDMSAPPDRPGVSISFTTVASNSKRGIVNIFMAGAEDFTFLYFTGVPPVYYYDNPPVPP